MRLKTSPEPAPVKAFGGAGRGRPATRGHQVVKTKLLKPGSAISNKPSASVAVGSPERGEGTPVTDCISEVPQPKKTGRMCS